MIPRSTSLLWSCLLICVCARIVSGEDVELKCDEFTSCTDYNCDYSIGPYCTVTGLRITHSQHVVVNKNKWPLKVSSSYYTFMKFYDSSLLYIAPTIFNEFQELKKLDVSGSNVVELTRNTFTSAKQLDWLNLSRNNISETTGSVFVGADKLLVIDMSYNRIAKLSEHTFKGLKALAELNLAYNQIDIIHDDMFVDNVLLEVINLKKNRIEHLGDRVFGKLLLLNTVSLAHNRMTRLDPNLFVNSINLLSIDVSQNRLKSLHLNVGGYFKTIIAQNNEIENFFINCTISQFTYRPDVEGVNSSCLSLEHIELSNNSVENLKNFTNFSKLQSLSLANNNIGRLNISSLSKLIRLTSLNLRNTSLSGLTFGTFSGQGKLISLDLSDNNLNHLNLDIFLPYMYLNLKELYIKGNNLSEIQGRHTFASFSSLRKLDLRANRFNCSYLLHLIAFANFSSSVEFSFEGGDVVDNREHVHGIECIPDEKGGLTSDNGIMTKKSSQVKYSLSYEASMVHVNLLEQHLLMMKCFVIFLAFLGLCFLAYKVVHILADRRKSFVNIISYRSTNTIQSDVDI